LPEITKRAGDIEPRFLDGYLPYLLAHAAWLLSGQFQRHLAAKGVRFSVWRLLVSLVGTNGLTIGELADELLLQQPTVTKIVDRLVTDGLVARRSSPGDRRRVIVDLTPRGSALVRVLRKEAEQHQNAVLAAYSKSEVETLFRVLRTVLARKGANSWGKPQLIASTRGRRKLEKS
jgi:MarR family transcriptional regulator, organic hydroperoxide resistance regulator